MLCESRVRLRLTETGGVGIEFERFARVERYERFALIQEEVLVNDSIAIGRDSDEAQGDGPAL